MKPTRVLPTRLLTGAAGCLMLCGTWAFGQQLDALPSTMPATQPSAQNAADTGLQYISRTFSVQFTAPPGCRQVDASLPDLVAEFANSAKDWHIQVSRITFEAQEPLTVHPDQFGKPQNGQLEKRIDDVRRNLQATIIRNEVIPVGRASVGMLSYRFNTGNRGTMFEQVAIIDAPDTNDRMFYIVDMTGPGQPPNAPAGQIDPGEKEQFEAFGKMVDSTQLLPLNNLRKQQDQWMYNTLTLFTLWDSGINHQRVLAAIVPVQYQRILRNGRDTGWVYIGEEEHISDKERASIDVGVHSWMKTDDEQIWEFQTVYHSSLDRAHERWDSLITCKDPDGKPLLTITRQGDGNEDSRIMPNALPAPIAAPANGQPAAAQNNGPTIQKIRMLHVKQTYQGPDKLVVKTAFDNPAYASEYIPQVYCYILPTIIPLDHPDTYQFAEFKPSGTNAIPGGAAGTVMRRYVDVSAQHSYTFNGSQYDGYEISDKVGLDGKPTTYYMDKAGKLIGSSTFDGNVQVVMLPTTAAQLQRLWQNPNLIPPNPTPADPTSSADPK